MHQNRKYHNNKYKNIKLQYHLYFFLCYEIQKKVILYVYICLLLLIQYKLNTNNINTIQYQIIQLCVHTLYIPIVSG